MWNSFCHCFIYDEKNYSEASHCNTGIEFPLHISLISKKIEKQRRLFYICISFLNGLVFALYENHTDLLFAESKYRISIGYSNIVAKSLFHTIEIMCYLQPISVNGKTQRIE